MKMYTEKQKTSNAPAVIIVLLIIAGVFVWWYYWPEKAQPIDSPTNATNTTADTNDDKPDGTKTTGKTGSKTGGRTIKPRDPNAQKPAPGPKGMTRALAAGIGPSPITTPPVSRKVTEAAYTQGKALHEKNIDLLKARKLLNQAYNSGHLSDVAAAYARGALTDLAARTVLKPDPYVNPKDPYMVSHKWRAGELLTSKRRGGRIVTPGIIARYDLNTPWRIVPIVNGLASATQFRAGRNYKLLKGPFHMVVYKSKFAADIYLQDLFVKRIPVCIGTPETPTPEGYFRVVFWIGKTPNSTYYPPAETGRANTPIYPTEPGYPLGPNGYNIKIEGIGQLGTNISASQSYAIHGTNDPSSIGQARSRGCLRLDAKDMKFVYAALMDYADPNDPKATWTRWSTITIKP